MNEIATILKSLIPCRMEAVWGCITGVSITFDQSQAACEAHNKADGTQTGWHLQNLYERSAVALLCMLEIGSPDAQGKIGAGNSSSNAAVATGSSNASWRGYRLARKRNVKAAKIRFKAMSWLYRYGFLTLADVKARVASFLGYMKFCDGKRTTISTLKHLVLRRGR